MVRHIDILGVLFYVRALHIGALKIAKRSHHNIGIHFHKKRNQSALAQIIWNQTRLFFGELKNLIVGIGRYIVNMDIGVRQEPFNGTLKVLIKSARLRIEHKVFTDCVEESSIVALLASGIRIALEPLLC